MTATEFKVSPKEALEKLQEGNRKYISGENHSINTSALLRQRLVGGQSPYAVIVTCADSRVVPEAIFSAGIGELFVIRIAGNVIDNHQLGSIEYAAEHLGTGLVVILGHTHCGAVDAALNHNPAGNIKYITDEISKAVGDEKDEYKACCLNALHSKQTVEESLRIQQDEHEHGFKVVAAIYDIESGKVDFLL